MRDPHPILQDGKLENIDLTQRVPRTSKWDDYSLSDFPTDDIMPVCLSDNTELSYLQPTKPKTLCKVYSRWIYEMYSSAADTGAEYLFRTDAYGNVYGIKEGEVKNGMPTISLNDHGGHYTFSAHTHPPGYSTDENLSYNLPPPGFSKPDLNVIEDGPELTIGCVVPCPDRFISTRIFIVTKFPDEYMKEEHGQGNQDTTSMLDRYRKELANSIFHQAENVEIMRDPGSDGDYKNRLLKIVKDSEEVFSSFIEDNSVALNVVKLRFEDGYAVPDEDLDIMPKYDPYEELL
jgi:hypothetical protein